MTDSQRTIQRPYQAVQASIWREFSKVQSMAFPEHLHIDGMRARKEEDTSGSCRFYIEARNEDDPTWRKVIEVYITMVDLAHTYIAARSPHLDAQAFTHMVATDVSAGLQRELESMLKLVDTSPTPVVDLDPSTPPDPGTNGWDAVFDWEERYGRARGITTDAELGRLVNRAEGTVANNRSALGRQKRKSANDVNLS